MLLGWDQLVMMPAEGAGARAQQLGTLARLTHERATAEEIGEWLAELDGPGAMAQLDELDRDIVRLARRDWERARRVPAELAAELARRRAPRARSAGSAARAARRLRRVRAGARAQRRARAGVRRMRRRGRPGRPTTRCSATTTSGCARTSCDACSARSPRRCRRSSREAALRSPRRELAVPVAAQQAAVAGTLRRLGVDDASWRVDVSAHPFTAWMGRRDTRLTTRYSDGDVESLLSSLHEYGHALYERQIDPALERTNLGRGTSMSIHESQSKLWENHVARSPAFAEVLAGELARAGFAVAAGRAARERSSASKRSLIRVSADPLTYPLHIILRFELELALIDGDLAVADLPGAWRDGMRRLLGVEVPSDALGCLQDVHWGAGSLRLLPELRARLPDRGAAVGDDRGRSSARAAEDLRRGEVGAIQRWLGRARAPPRTPPRHAAPLVEQATGRALEIEPFLRYVAPLAGPDSCASTSSTPRPTRRPTTTRCAARWRRRAPRSSCTRAASPTGRWRRARGLRAARALLPLGAARARRRAVARARASKLAEHVPDMLRYRRAARAADVVHFQWLAGAAPRRHLLPARRSRVGARRPLVLTAHDVLPREPRPGQRAAQRRLYERFDAVVVHSEHGRAAADRRARASTPERVHVIPHGVLRAPRRRRGRGAQPPRRSTTEQPVVLCFGLMRPYKGIDVLLEAWRGIERRRSCGSSGMPRMDIAPLRAARARRACASSPRFITDDELPAYFRRADLVVLPYREIDQSGVLFTALGVRQAAAAERRRRLPRDRRDAARRAPFPAGDAARCTRALRELLGDPAALAAMAARARDAAGGRVLVGARSRAQHARAATSSPAGAQDPRGR